MTQAAPLERRVANLPGARVTFRVGGSGPPLVLIHGLGASSRWWSRNVADLAMHFRVHLVDLPGFGESWRQRFAVESSADVLAAWADSVGIARASWVGQSMGGLVAARLAADHPELVERLVLVDAAGMPFETPFRQQVLRLFGLGTDLAGAFVPAAIVDFFRAGPLLMARAGHEIINADLVARIRRIRSPTLVVWGEQDPLIPATTGAQLAALIPGARFVVIPRAGHNVMWDRPRAFADAVIPFLRGQPADDGAAPRVVDVPPAARGLIAPDAASVRRGLTSRYASVDGRPVHVRVGGPHERDAGVPIVLIHGFVISSRYMVPLGRRLARRHAVYAPDLPGFGWSGKPVRVLDVPGLAAALVATLDVLGLERVVLVGNSLGCQVAVEVAARRPERVVALVLIAPTFDRTIPTLFEQAARLLLLDAVREKWPLPLLHIPDYLLAGLGRARETLRYAWAHRIEAVVPGVSVPTLVVRGSRDPLVTRRWARFLTERLPDGRLAEIPGAPHAANFSAPDRVRRVIEQFLDSSPGATAPR